MERRCRLFLAYFCIVVQGFRLCGGDEGDLNTNDMMEAEAMIKQGDEFAALLFLLHGESPPQRRTPHPC